MALPAPARADRVAVDAEAWFHYYRLSIDVFHAKDHRFTGVCVRGWSLGPQSQGRHPRQPRRRYRNVRRLWPGSVLAFSGGPVVLATGKHRVRHVYGKPRAGLPAFLAVAIGCTESLATALTEAVQSNGHLSIERAYAANQPALALELRLHNERLTLYLSPRRYRPLVVVGAVVGGGIAASRLYLTHLTPAQVAKFRRLLPRNGFPSSVTAGSAAASLTPSRLFGAAAALADA